MRHALRRSVWVIPVACLPLLASEDDALRQIIERGPNHAVHQHCVPTFDELGRPMTVTNSWTQLEDGLNYWNSETESWTEAREEIELAARGAVARHGQHRILFSPNANDPAGCVDIEVNHRVRFRNSLLALRYFDPATGAHALLATIRDAPGELVPPNQIIYRDIFDHVRADLVYTVRKSGLEADVVLREIPPSPDEVNLRDASAAVRLEVVTEFFEAPEPTKREHLLAKVEDPDLRDQVAEPDWIDEELEFGESRLSQGRAFAWSAREAAAAAPEGFPPVGKRWIRTPDHRTLLIEAAEYSRLLDELMTLPGPQDRAARVRRDAQSWARPEIAGSYPARLRISGAGLNAHRSPVQWAGVPRRPRATDSGKEAFPSRITVAAAPFLTEPGVVMDYTMMVVGEYNYTFRCDETYHITGNCWFTGTTILEGGTVIKFQKCTDANPWINLCVTGPLDCRTSLYRPAVFTAETDNTVGALIDAGVHDPTAYYGYRMLRLRDTSAPARVEYLRLKHGNQALSFEANTQGNVARHVQMVDCQQAVSATTSASVSLQNVLIDAIRPGGYAFYGAGTTFRGEHFTIHNTPNLVTGGTLVLTNSLLVAVSAIQGYSGAGNAELSSATGVFQEVGGGKLYLAYRSPHRDAGVTGLSPGLPEALAGLTTYPPVVLPFDFTADTTLEPVALRDTDRPDRGYHYPPLDYCFTSLNLSARTLTLTNGVAIGLYGSKGLVLNPGARLISEGSAARLNHIVRFNTVQEQTLNWGNASQLVFVMFDNVTTYSPFPSLALTFTEIAHPAVGKESESPRVFLRSLGSAPLYPISLSMNHCLVRGILLEVDHNTTAQGASAVAMTNTLFEGSIVRFEETAGGTATRITAYNNLFFRGRLILSNPDNGATWIIRDNLFHCDVLTFASPNILASHNGFHSSLTPFGSSAKSGLTLTYGRGPMGQYYQGAATSANLANQGSRYAHEAGLAHFTTRLDQQKEGNSLVDIGFHYPAAGPSADGLVGSWRLDEMSGTQASDTSANLLHGVLANGPIWDHHGVQDGCLGFDGVNDIVSVPHSVPLEIGRNNADFTVVFWIRLREGPTGSWRSLLHKGGTGQERTPALYLWDQSNRLHYRISTAYHWNEGGDSVQSLAVGQWTHVAMVKAGNTARLFLNGVLDSQVALSGGSVHNTGPLYFGDTPFYNGANAQWDELKLYNRALADHEILACMSVLPADSDGDGLADTREDRNGNGASDPGETLLSNVDSDEDGQSDREEVAEGTDPMSSADVLPTRLAYLRFNSEDLRGEEGQIPLERSGIQWVPSVDGHGVQFGTGPAVLRYKGLEANGTVNLDPQYVGVRLLFKPDWNSAAPGVEDPLNGDAHLFTLGDAVGTSGSGYIEFYVSADGNELSAKTSRDGSPENTTHVRGSVITPYFAQPSPFKKGRWHELVFGLRSDRIVMWKDSELIQSTTIDVAGSLAPRALLAHGISLGGRANGTSLCRGTIDEVQICNFAPESTISREPGNLAHAEAVANPPAIRLRWHPRVFGLADFVVERRLQGSGSGFTAGWTAVPGSPVMSHDYTDILNEGEVGRIFHYRVRIRDTSVETRPSLPCIIAAVEAPPILKRGRALLLIDADKAPSITSELNQFVSDLVGDGWQVITETVPRHTDTEWQVNIPHIASIKATIKAHYDASKNMPDDERLKALILIGHVAVPYVGMQATDGHTGILRPDDPQKDNHFGAWSSDVYYADVDGEWADAEDYNNLHPIILQNPPYQWWPHPPPPPPRVPITRNIPGDSKWDWSKVPRDSAGLTRVEMCVGRIDFANQAPFHDEVSLLKRYLGKNHRFRHGATRASPRAVVFNSWRLTEFPQSNYGRLGVWGPRIMGRFFGSAKSSFAHANLFAATNSLSYLWGFQAGNGNISKIGPVDAITLAEQGNEPKVAFAVLWGSWFCDWNLRDAWPHDINMIQSFLCGHEFGLAAIGWPTDSMARFGLGYHLGDFQTEFFDYRVDFMGDQRPEEAALPREFGILGDPTLRWPGVSPPGDLTDSDAGTGVFLKWTPLASRDVRYHVLRSGSRDGPFVEVTPPEGISGNTYSVAGGPVDMRYWQVRAAVLTQSGSGSFLESLAGNYDRESDSVNYMNTITAHFVCLVSALSFGLQAAPFLNLDFEQGDTSSPPIEEYLDGSSKGYAESWLPGWRLFEGLFEGDSVYLNRGLGSGGASSLYDAGYLWGLPRDGKLAFVAMFSLPAGAASLQQSGQVPADAKSLHYSAHGGPWEVRVNGMKLDLHGWDDNDQSLTFQDVGVDISAWAGQEVELRFTQTADYSFCAIDSIRFSTELIPEPENGAVLFLGWGVLSLLAGARAVVCARRRRDSSTIPVKGIGLRR